MCIASSLVYIFFNRFRHTCFIYTSPFRICGKYNACVWFCICVNFILVASLLSSYYPLIRAPKKIYTNNNWIYTHSTFIYYQQNIMHLKLIAKLCICIQLPTHWYFFYFYYNRNVCIIYRLRVWLESYINFRRRQHAFMVLVSSLSINNKSGGKI